MLLKGPAATRALASPDPAIRLYVLGGPDESGSRALAASLARTLSAGAERIDLSASKLKDDPAMLADEAAAISMFGGPRWISISIASGSGDDILPACTALLEAAAAGNPAVVIGGDLTARSKLVKLAEGSALAVAVISYPPDAGNAAVLARDLAKAEGLELGPQVAQAIVAATGADRALMAQEITKLALYCDASQASPARAEIDAWHSIGAGIQGDDVSVAVNILLEGRLRELPELFATLEATGGGGIGLVRAIGRRAVDLANLRAHVEGGLSPGRAVEAYGKGIFWKEQKHVTLQVKLWSATAIARLIERLHAIERTLKASGDAGELILRGALLDIARAAALAGRQ